MSFKGSFDGNNFEISNIYIKESKNYQGLFGKNSGLIENIKINGNIISSGIMVGGIVAINTGTIINCHNNAFIQENDLVAGIAGESSNESRIEKCSNNSEIYSTYNNVGGILGSGGGIIKECFNNKYIHANSVTAGGIVGYISVGTIYNCYNIGNVQAGSNIGGICGAAGISTSPTVCVYNCYNVGNIIGNTNNGNIIGLNNANGGSSQSINCYSSNISVEQLNNGIYSDNAYTNDSKDKDGNWIYNNGYPILKWQLER